MKELTVAADIKNVEVVTDFVDEILAGYDCPLKVIMQVNVAIDELFSNIAYYAYEAEGDATVRVEIIEESMEIVLTFLDNGIPYNPLEKEDPDTTLSAEEREIGGLGIFMVKKTMDDVKYEYKDGQNILKIVKKM